MAATVQVLWKLKLILLLVCYVLGESEFDRALRTEKLKIMELDPTRVKPIHRTREDVKRFELEIYCYPGTRRKSLFKIWSSATVHVRLSTGNDVRLYYGRNESHVFHQFQETSQSWFTLMPWKTDTVTVPVFNKTCLGVETKHEYSVDFIIKTVDPWLVACMISGLLLFYSAKRLSRNVVFYYGTGISVGLIASLLILVFILSRFMAKKYGAYAIIIGGWSLALFLLQYVWDNIQTVLESYYWYFIGYFALSGVLSFGYCYYKGPVNNPRSLDLIKWTIQLVGLVLLYNGCQIYEIGVALVVLVLLQQNCPACPGFLKRRVKTMWRRRFPPKHKLLTEDEYQQQANEETKKALEELRTFCRSPDCDAWRTISRLGSPNKFANWVEGDSHVTEDEILHYESDTNHVLKYDTDDESEISFSLNSQ